MAEVLTTLARLLVVRETQLDANGALLYFQGGCQGRIPRGESNYATHLRMAQRSQERKHPVGVSFGEGQTITDLIRADNDLPAQLLEDNGEALRVLFQGHDGVFVVSADHPNSARIRAMLDEALRQKARVWFIARTPDLALLDVQLAA